MPWLYLIIAGILETGWAVGLKYTDGFSKLAPSLLTVGCMVISIGLLGLAMRDLPVGTAYAIWTGIGTVGAVVFGMILLGDPATIARISCIGLILAGIIGLKLTS